jgi:hypothetical protein
MNQLHRSLKGNRLYNTATNLPHLTLYDIHANKGSQGSKMGKVSMASTMGAMFLGAK